MSDDQTDASLSLVAAPTLGSVPNLALVASWRGRLWGVDRAKVDYVSYTEAGLQYSWPNTNLLPIGRQGSDLRGVTALIARRDALGVGRQQGLFQITGTSNSDFRVVTLAENIGVESQETVKVYKDIAYFLGKDGVYSWGADGLKNLSDNKTRAWFNTDTYFNRARFQYAFASIDSVKNRYRLHLAAAGSSTEDRWVEYDIVDGSWWGPHKTAALTPVSADGTTDANGAQFPLIGSSNGYLWKDQATRTDDTATAIDFDVDTKRHDGNSPMQDKMFGELTVIQMTQSTGRMTVTPSVGDLDAAAKTQTLQSDLTMSSRMIGRVGVGSAVKLNFSQATAGQNVQLLGYELEFFELGTRR